MQLTEIRDRLRSIQAKLREYWGTSDPEEMDLLFTQLSSEIDFLYEDVQAETENAN